MRMAALISALSLLPAGCAGDAGGGTAGPADGGRDAAASADAAVGGDAADLGPGPIFEAPPGRLDLRLAEWGLTLQGGLLDGPRVDLHQEAGREGQCRLLTFEPGTCTPACDLPAACLAGACVGQPTFASAGTLALSGVPGGPISVAPNPTGGYWYQTEAITLTDVTGPMRVVAPGDVAAGFDLQVPPVAPVTPEGSWEAAMAARGAGEDVTLRWQDPAPGARVTLRMTTGIGTHGGVSPVEVECEGPDTGSLTLPGAYLDALYAQGWSCGECGGNDLVRYVAADADTTPRVQLRAIGVTTFFYRP